MSMQHDLPPGLETALVTKTPLLWANWQWLPIDRALESCPYGRGEVLEAARRLDRFSGLLQRLFPDLALSGGVIDSPLRPGDRLRENMSLNSEECGRWFIKCDHELPVSGSIKARGGIYEVLVHAELLARRAGFIRSDEDPLVLASDSVRRFFGQHRILVGSTGNLGLSIGMAASALGFKAEVHMSADAKQWKKASLRKLGVEVVEHSGDFGAAVAAGRAATRSDPCAYFVDDERSHHLFFGYSVAAIHLCRQLAEIGIVVDARHPLFVYLPCGVGGAPSGITFGMRCMLGDHVHCFFAEPTASPSMLISLGATDDRVASLSEMGLDGQTEADGLAVSRASEFVTSFIRPFVSGVFTVPDERLLEDVYRLHVAQGLRIEPSAAAGVRGPQWLSGSAVGRQYLASHGALDYMRQSIHVLWSTGGALLPEEEYATILERGRRLALGA